MGKKSLLKQEWFMAMVLGILTFVFGVSFSLYLSTGSSNLAAIMPIFFAGWGFGYIICSFTIRKWEKKSWEIGNKARADEQPEAKN
jgi:uncharacterized membrane protein HdeD (DUF308 family)